MEIRHHGLHYDPPEPHAGTPAMSDDSYYYEPANGHGLPHGRSMPSSARGRRLDFVTRQHGRLNLAPYSFFNAFNYIPPIIGFSSVGRKDSLNNIEQTGEFVEPGHPSVGRADEPELRAVGPEVSEFELSA
jgi:hypothetical protein